MELGVLESYLCSSLLLLGAGGQFAVELRELRRGGVGGTRSQAKHGQETN